MSKLTTWSTVSLKMDDSVWSVVFVENDGDVSIGLFWADKETATHETTISKAEFRKICELVASERS